MSRCSILALQLLFLAAAASTATARFRSAVEQQVPEQQLAAAAVVSDETAGLRQLRQSPRTFDVSNLPTRTATTAAGELPAWDSPPEATASKGSPFDTTKSSTSSSGSSNSGNAGTKLQPTAGPAQSAPPVTRPTLAPAPAVKEAPKAAPTPPPPTPKPEPAVAKEPPPPSKPAITPAFQPSQSISVNGGSSSSTAAGTDKGSRSSSGGGGGSGSALAPAPVPVTAVAPTPEPVRLPPTCPSGRSLKVHAASSSRMCVLQKATATEGLVWNAIGQQVSYSQAQKCYVAACPEGVQPEIPGQVPKSNIVTAQSAQRGTAQQQQPPAAAAAAAEGDGPTIIEIEEAEAGRRLLGAAAVQQDVFMVMNFAASCFSMCE